MSALSKFKIKDTGRHLNDALDRTYYGRVISSRFFKRYLFQTTFIVGLILIYISNRYDCVTGMETINALQSELDIVRTELQNQRSSYMSMTRESAMQQLVDTLHLNLGIQQQPPYRINLIKDDADR